MSRCFHNYVCLDNFLSTRITVYNKRTLLFSYLFSVQVTEDRKGKEVNLELDCLVILDLLAMQVQVCRFILCYCYLWTNMPFSWFSHQFYIREFPSDFAIAWGRIQLLSCARAVVMLTFRDVLQEGHCMCSGGDCANSDFILPATGLPGPPGTPGSPGPQGPPGPNGRCNPADCYYHVSQTRPRTSGK